MTAKKNPAKPTVKIDPPLTDVEKAFLALQNAADARAAAIDAALTVDKAYNEALDNRAMAEGGYADALRKLDYALRGITLRESC